MNETNPIKELRRQTGLSQRAFAAYLGIPRRTVENWEAEVNKCPQYVIDLIRYKLEHEGKIKEHQP